MQVGKFVTRPSGGNRLSTTHSSSNQVLNQFLMPIPTLEPNGLLPNGIHDCSLEDISAQFTWNDHGAGLFGRFQRFLSMQIKPEFPYPIFFDGSFVTDKELPDDTVSCLIFPRSG